MYHISPTLGKGIALCPGHKAAFIRTKGSKGVGAGQREAMATSSSCNSWDDDQEVHWKDFWLDILFKSVYVDLYKWLSDTINILKKTLYLGLSPWF